MKQFIEKDTPERTNREASSITLELFQTLIFLKHAITQISNNNNILRAIFKKILIEYIFLHGLAQIHSISVIPGLILNV